MTNHLIRRHDRIALAVVGDIQKPANEIFVTGDALLLPRLPVTGRAAFHYKATLGTHRHDNSVLNHLSFD